MINKTYYSYGIWNINSEDFSVDLKEVDDNNKVQGGLWACPYHSEYYSEWVLFTLAFPFLYKAGIAKGTLFKVKECSNILTLSLDNYKEFMDCSKLDINKINKYDAIIFKKELCENIKEFEAYYVESIQILNLNIVDIIEEKSIEFDVIMTDKNRNLTLNLAQKISDIVMKSEVAESLLKQGE